MPGSIIRDNAPTIAVETPISPDPSLRPSYDLQAILWGLQPIQGTPAAEYLASRLISLEMAGQCPIRYGPKIEYPAEGKDGPFTASLEAVVFGLRGKDGEFKAYQARNIRPKGPKFMTFKNEPDQRHNAVFATVGAFEVEAPIIVEAPLDALTLASCGFPAIATVGTQYAEWLVPFLALRPVILAHDADEAGDKAAAGMAAQLRELGADPRRLRPTGAKDWNDMAKAHGIEQLKELLKAALTAKRVFSAPSKIQN